MRHLDVVAKRRVGGSEGWEVYHWERIGDGDDLVVEGGVPRLIESGPLKGEMAWDGPGQQAVVTGGELDAEVKRYEEEMGKCGGCGGTGVRCWHAGLRRETWRRCVRCNGTGGRPDGAATQPHPSSSSTL